MVDGCEFEVRKGELDRPFRDQNAKYEASYRVINMDEETSISGQHVLQYGQASSLAILALAFCHRSNASHPFVCFTLFLRPVHRDLASIDQRFILGQSRFFTPFCVSQDHNSTILSLSPFLNLNLNLSYSV